MAMRCQSVLCCFREHSFFFERTNVKVVLILDGITLF